MNTYTNLFYFIKNRGLRATKARAGVDIQMSNARAFQSQERVKHV